MKIKWVEFIPEEYVRQESIDDTNEDEDEDIVNTSGGALQSLIFNERVKIETPLGTLYPDNPFDPIHNTPIYVGYTDFDVNSYNSTLKQIEGVEFGCIYGRYRFIVGIGPMFDIDTVLDNIVSKLTNDSSRLDKIKSIIREEITESDEYIAYVYPNGSYTYRIPEDWAEDGKQASINSFEKLRDLSHGQLVIN